MKGHPLQKSTLAVLAVIIPLLALFIYVALRSGPLAPVPVTLAGVEDKALAPALFGIGTVEARYTYKIGPTFAGRIKGLDVHVGDQVKAGQVLGAMDPVDLDQRLLAHDAALKRAQAQADEARARHTYARTQAERYEQLLKVRSTSEELVATKRQELQIAEAGLNAAGGAKGATRSPSSSTSDDSRFCRMIMTSKSGARLRSRGSFSSPTSLSNG